MNPETTAGDFRKLTPLVLMTALRAAGTHVCEPIERFTVEVPIEVVGETCSRLAAARAELEQTHQAGERCRVSGTIPTAEVHRFEQRLPDLTGGTGVFDSQPTGYQPVRGEAPSRRRTDLNPLNRKLYLRLASQS